MYSQYIDGNFSPLASQSQQHTVTQQHSSGKSSESTHSNRLPGGLIGEITQLFKGIGSKFSIERLDTGDILLVLIILLILLEGDNLELVITLGLMLLLGFNEN